MTRFLLSVHVLAAIVAIVPVTVAAGMFPATLRRALGDPDARTVLRTLHRICRVYARIGIAVPLFGPAPPPAPTPWTPGRLAMATGVFNLLWATVTVLMIIRPDSTVPS